MTTPSEPMQFGWEGDGGLGERLVRQVLAGEKWATCSPKAQYSEAELAGLYGSVGQVLPLMDGYGDERGRVRITAVYDTTFGDPHPRLVRGEGNGEDAEAFKREHREAWAEEMAAEGNPLTDGTVLVVEEFELVDEG